MPRWPRYQPGPRARAHILAAGKGSTRVIGLRAWTSAENLWARTARKSPSAIACSGFTRRRREVARGGSDTARFSKDDGTSTTRGAPMPGEHSRSRLPVRVPRNASRPPWRTWSRGLRTLPRESFQSSQAFSPRTPGTRTEKNRGRAAELLLGRPQPRHGFLERLEYFDLGARLRGDVGLEHAPEPVSHRRV